MPRSAISSERHAALCGHDIVELMCRAGRIPHFAGSPASHGSRSTRRRVDESSLATFALQLDAFEGRLKVRSPKTTLKAFHHAPPDIANRIDAAMIERGN